ncbi:zf-HC2 domain-containing protein, partial [Streptomyces sp. TRM76130]|nr:zf-HC2 domain-containing protein [Streptomyces sp. TRM76130]
MSSTTDMARHPDVAEISDLAEGLLPPSRSMEVRRHLDACELCADVHASLGGIRGLLGTLPGPLRMPDDVVCRIDAALAAEALLAGIASGPTGGSQAHGASAPLSGGDGPPRVSRETSVAVGRPAGRATTSTTGPGRKNHTWNGRRRIAAFGAVFAVAALGISSVIVSSLDGGDAP